MKQNRTQKEWSFVHTRILFFAFVLAVGASEIVCAQPCTFPADAGAISGLTTICQGQTSVNYTVPQILNATSYVWTLPSGANGISITNTITVNYSASAISGDITVKGKSTCGEGGVSSLAITVNQLPISSFDFSPDNQCSPMVMTFTNTSTGSSSFNSFWDFGDTKTSVQKDPSYSFDANAGNGTQAYPVKLIVTDKVTNCASVASTKPVVVKQSPDVALNGIGSSGLFDGVPLFKVCSNNVSIFTFTNGSSTKATNTNYTINWGDGSPDFDLTSWTSVTHTFQIGKWNLVYRIKGQNGCSNFKKYIVFVGSNPAVSTGNPGNTDFCISFAKTFPILGTDNNPSGTTYTVSFNDGSPPQVFKHPPPSDVTHVFLKSSCGTTSSDGTNSYPNSFSAIIVAKNPCSTSSVGVVPIYVSTPPEANFSVPQDIVCTNNKICFTNTTTGANDYDGTSCSSSAKLIWLITPSTGFTLASGSLGSDPGLSDPNLWTLGTDQICPVFSKEGKYTITLKTANRCGSDIKTKTICVEPPIVPQFTLSTPTSGCSPLSVTATNTTDVSNSCSLASYSWTVTYSGSNCGASSLYSYTGGTNSSSKDPSFQFTNPGTYSIKLAVTSSCGVQTSNAQTITVKQPPTVSINTIQSICQTLPTTTINPTASIANCGVDPLVYEWSFPGGNPATSSSEIPGSISYSTSGDYSVSLTVKNECGTTSATNNTFAIYPSPIITGVLSACAGSKSQLVGSATPAANSPWVSSNTSIATVDYKGLVTAVSAGTSSITYTNNNGCKIVSTFTVNALPTITGSLSAGIRYTSQLTGSATAAAILPWESSEPSVATIDNTGLVTAISLGTTLITYTNTDGCQVKVLFTVSPLPTISGILSACIGSVSQLSGSGTTASSFPWISSNISVATINNLGFVTAISEGITNITFTNSEGSKVVSSFIVNALPTITGVLSACVNSTSQLSGSGTAASVSSWMSSNTSVAKVDNTGLVTAVSAGTSSITYTNSNGCKVTSVFTVNALPTVTGVLSACNGSTSQFFGSATADATLAWASSNNAIAIVSNTGLVNALSVGTSTISYINSNGCQTDVIFTVKPIPSVDQPSNLEVCNGLQTNIVTFSGSVVGTDYNWKSSDLSIGLPSVGTGEIKPFTAHNAGTSAVIAPITVTPIANGCSGSPLTFTITVNPSPIVTFSLENQTICSGENTAPVTLNSTTTGVTYFWTADSPSGISGSEISGSDIIPVQTLLNTTNIPLVVTYKAKASLTASTSCIGAEYFYTITVKPKLLVSEKLAAKICSGSTFTITPSNDNGNIIPSGTTYTWSLPTISPVGALSGATAQSVPQTTIGQQLMNGTNDIATATYHVTSLSGGCAGLPFDVIVTVYPTPTVNLISNISLCNGVVNPKINILGAVAETVYNWTNNNSSTGLAVSGSGAIPAFTAVNTGIAPKIATITVTPSANGCEGLPMTFTITVNPLLPVSVSIINSINNVCPGTPVSFTATPGNGGLNPDYHWKVNGDGVGTGSAFYTYTPNDGDMVECQLFSDAICPIGNNAKSNVVKMVVLSSLPASISIVESVNNICPGESASFTATPSNGGNNPTYQWFVNNIKVGTNQPFYSYEPANGDIVNCQLMSSNSCSSNGAASSSPITMYVSPPALQPSFTIEQMNDCAPIRVLMKNNSLSGGVAYIWDFGDGSTYTSDNPTDVPHTFENFTSEPIVFTVSLKIITRFTHCFNILTKQIIVKPELFAGSPVSYTGCSPFIQKFENAYAGAKSYRWIDSKKTLLSTKFQPTLTFTTSKGRDSTYIVYLIAESSFGCYDTILNTIKVSPTLEIPSFSYSGNADCKSVTYVFNNTSKEGPKLFEWNFDDGTINRTVHANEALTHTFFNGSDKVISFNVILTSSSGASCSLSISKKIMVDPDFIAGFPITYQGCSPMERTFRNAYVGAKSYEWKSVDGVLLSKAIAPTLSFSASLGRDSTYLVYLIAKSMNGCVDTVVNKIIVRAANKAEFLAIPTEGCSPLLVQFSNSSSSQTKSYQWDFGDGSDCSIAENPSRIFIDSKGLDVRYKVSLIAFNQYGCSDTAFHEVHLFPTPQVDFKASPVEQIYPNRTIQLSNLTYPGNWIYTWNFGDQKPLVLGDVTNYTYNLPGEYIISLTAKGAYCESVKRNKVIINPGAPLASFEPDTSGCAPLKLNFRNYSKNGSHYQWDFGNNTQSVDFSPSTTYYDEGKFIVKLNVFNQFGVMSATERSVVVHPVPKALFKPLPYRVKIPGQAVTFFNSSENANEFLWDFGDEGSSIEVQPVHQYTQTGMFDVTLFITSFEGCKDTFLLADAVEVFSDGLKVPNAIYAE